MADFGDSSHSACWVFMSPANVYGHRLEAMARDDAVYSIDLIGAGETDDVRAADKSGVYDSVASSMTDDNGALERLVEEEAVLRHYCRQIQLVAGCGAGRDPSLPMITKTWRLAATAIVYFRRFYISNNLLAHDPRVMMLSCILLAGKVEESNVSLRELLKVNSKIQLEDILHSELKLMQGLHFHLKVFHPQSIATTLIVDMKRATSSSSSAQPPIDGEAIKEWLASVERLLDLSLITEAPLCYSPLDLAIAALLASKPPSLGRTLQDFLSRRFGHNLAEEMLQQAPDLTGALTVAQACIEGRELETVKHAMDRFKAKAAWGGVAKAARKKMKMEQASDHSHSALVDLTT